MGLLDFFRRAPEPPDAFAERVRELVSECGEVDELPRGSACRLASEMFIRGLSEASDSDTNDGKSPHLASTSRFLQALSVGIARVADRVLGQRIPDADVAGEFIVDECLGPDAPQPYLSANELPLLVGTAYGAGHELRRRDPELARQLASNEKATPPEAEEEPATELEGEPTSELEGEPTSELESELAQRIVNYGLTSDERMVDEITPLYLRANSEVPQENRLRMLLAVIRYVEEGKLSGNALMPFIFRDTDFQVISTAVLHAGAVWPGAESDPMIGVRELAGYARSFAQSGDEGRAASIYTGLLNLGDRRVIRCVGPCWRSLSLEGRHLLSRMLGDRAYAGLIDWLVEWLEECEGGEFGAVSGTLARITSVKVPGEVTDVRRAIPIWDVPEDRVITVVERVSFREYALKIRHRLLQLAADEQSPRVMHDVLKSWGIDSNERHVAGIEMGATSAGEPRALLPLLRSALPDGPLASALLETGVALEDRDFVSRSGSLLLSWAIFNPYGPTWSCLGLLPTEDPAVDLLFYRMLNPFAQQSAALGLVRGDERHSSATLGGMVEALFARESIRITAGETIELIGGGLPDALHAVFAHEEFRQAMWRAFLLSPRMYALDVVRSIREIRQFSGNPWDRTTARIKDAIADGALDGTITPAQHDGETDQNVVAEWLGLVTSSEHIIGELIHFPSAWHGAIDHVSPELAHYAFTFWQLDDFLSRFGFLEFRAIAEVRARHEREQAAANRTDDTASIAELASEDHEPSYREEFEAFRQRLARKTPDDSDSVGMAQYAALASVTPQLAAAEERLEKVGRSTADLRRIMRSPWALGYLLGSAFAAIDRFRIPRQSHAATVVAGELHRHGLGRIAQPDMEAMSGRASRQPGFADGMARGARDLLECIESGQPRDGLLRWIEVQAGR